MRRKSERQSTRKAKASPEKKVEKLKRTRTTKRKQSSSSENETVDEGPTQGSSVTVVEIVEKKSPVKIQTPVKDDSAGDQVWQVKTAEGSSDSGEIQKLKICLTRPPTTPERIDRSPRSKRKSGRTTSSSDTPSVELVEDKRKTRHRVKRLGMAQSESHGEEGEKESSEEVLVLDKNDGNVQHVELNSNEKLKHIEEEVETIVEVEVEKVTTSNNYDIVQKVEISETKSTVDGMSNFEDNKKLDDPIESNKSDLSTAKVLDLSSDKTEPSSEINNKTELVHENTENEQKIESCNKIELEIDNSAIKEQEQEKIGENMDDSEVVIYVAVEENESTLNDEENKDKSVTNEIETHKEKDVSKETETMPIDNKGSLEKVKVDTEKDVHIKDNDGSQELPSPIVEQPTPAKDTDNDTDLCKDIVPEQSTPKEESSQNGQASLPVMSRKRRWGARPAKITTQKSVCISTDILKDIIPDVKPVEFEEIVEEKKQHKRVEMSDRVERPILPKIVIDNTEHLEHHPKERFEMEKENYAVKEAPPLTNRKISIMKENDSIITRPPSPPRHKSSSVLYITNLVRPFTLPQLKNLLQRTGRIVEDGFWIDKIKSKCYVKYETEDQAIETRHALHGVTWPVSNPKALHVDFSTQEAFAKAKANEDTTNAQATTIPGTVEDWLREQDLKRERGELEETRPWERRNAVREWDMGKGAGERERERDMGKGTGERERARKDDRAVDKRRHRTPERSPEPAKKFKKKEEEAPAKMLDDLFRKTKTTPCIYWLPLSAETIAIKEEQRRQHMAEHERRMQELRHSRAHRRH